MTQRCPYRYYSMNYLASQLQDNQCNLPEDHAGDHKKREIFPPPQQSTKPLEGWYKPQ